jgi:hypothetical protein
LHGRTFQKSCWNLSWWQTTCLEAKWRVIELVQWQIQLQQYYFKNPRNSRACTLSPCA